MSHNLTSYSNELRQAPLKLWSEGFNSSIIVLGGPEEAKAALVWGESGLGGSPCHRDQLGSDQQTTPCVLLSLMRGVFNHIPDQQFNGKDGDKPWILSGAKAGCKVGISCWCAPDIGSFWNVDEGAVELEITRYE